MDGKQNQETGGGSMGNEGGKRKPKSRARVVASLRNRSPEAALILVDDLIGDRLNGAVDASDMHAIYEGQKTKIAIAKNADVLRELAGRAASFDAEVSQEEAKEKAKEREDARRMAELESELVELYKRRKVS